MDLKLPVVHFVGPGLPANVFSFQRACPVEHELAGRGIWIHTKEAQPLQLEPEQHRLHSSPAAFAVLAEKQHPELMHRSITDKFLKLHQGCLTRHIMVLWEPQGILSAAWRRS